MAKAKSGDKFEFGTEFQEEILQYTLLDKNGYKALKLYEDYNFTLLEHLTIAYTIKRYFKRSKKIPKNKALFKELLKSSFQEKDFIDTLTEVNRKEILKIADKLFNGIVRDGEEILKACGKWASFIKMKQITETFDLTDFSQYEDYAKKVKAAISIQTDLEKKRGQFLIMDHINRVYERKFNESINPTPFWQLNHSTNGGGYERSGVIVFVGPEKEFKTGALINIARGYLKRKKKVAYYDLENGENPLLTRFEQSINKKNKKQILSGEFDESSKKLIRKYRRLGAEVYVRRLPALSTTADDIQADLDDIKMEYGITFDIIILDYIGNMGAISGAKDDFSRISDATLDFKNLCSINDFELGITAMHITKEGAKHFKTKFETADIAKCIDIPRHVDAVWGIQQDEAEANGGVLRLEVIDQRDGPNNCRALFWVNKGLQRMDEFSKKQLKAYYEEQKEGIDTESDDLK